MAKNTFTSNIFIISWGRAPGLPHIVLIGIRTITSTDTYELMLVWPWLEDKSYLAPRVLLRCYCCYFALGFCLINLITYCWILDQLCWIDSVKVLHEDQRLKAIFTTIIKGEICSAGHRYFHVNFTHTYENWTNNGTKLKFDIVIQIYCLSIQVVEKQDHNTL